MLLENTKEQREGWFYECMTTILMAAFKFEAYLNHAGAAIFPYWDEMERLPHKNKLSIICSHLGGKKTSGERPFQTLINLFDFRNAIAHGKSEFLDPPECIEVGDVEKLRRKKPLTGWEQLCTIEFAERAYEDTEVIMKLIHAAARLDDDELHHSGHSYVIKDVKELD